jgi:hypothetical protein
VTVNEAEPGQPGERLPLGYGRIRRGPMAADAFTQIRNAVFRDVRLSAKAMGIFGNISTHRDGWGVSAESIASQMKDGVAAVKGGLRELEEYGYLQRTQIRKPDGTLGGAVYYITDQPDAMPEQPEPPELEQSPSSEPSVENRPAVATSNDAQNRRSEPSVDSPPADKPPAENRTHKNTNPKSTKSKNTLSPRLPEQQATEPPASGDEREIDPAPVLAAYEDAIGRPLLGKVREQMEADARLRLEKGIPVAWLIDRARELAAKGWADLGLHCDRSVVPIHAGRPDGLAAPCDAHDPFNRFVTNDEGDLIPCPTCHPAALAAARRQGAA